MPKPIVSAINTREVSQYSQPPLPWFHTPCLTLRYPLNLFPYTTSSFFHESLISGDCYRPSLIRAGWINQPYPLTSDPTHLWMPYTTWWFMKRLGGRYCYRLIRAGWHGMKQTSVFTNYLPIDLDLFSLYHLDSWILGGTAIDPGLHGIA